MGKRNGKFYSKNEKEVMKSYGLDSTPMSGAGWLIKEDGQNEHIITQLKSTDSNSYRISLDDIDKLEYHALVENKIPLFIIEFLQRNERYFVIRPEDLMKLSKYLKIGEYKETNILNELNVNEENIENDKIKKITSSKKATKKFYEELENERKRKNEKFSGRRYANKK